MTEKLIIKWYGHSCFSVSYDGYTLVLDPYEDNRIQGLPSLRLRAHGVLCSHDHYDHNNRSVVEILPFEGARPFNIKKVDCFHDSVGGKKRGKCTIHILSAGGLKVAHFGDIGCELTAKQLDVIGLIDVAMLPVGGHYTVEPLEAQALGDMTAAKIIIPMHYRTDKFGFAEVAHINEYIAISDDCEFYESNEFILTEETPSQTAILQYNP